MLRLEEGSSARLAGCDTLVKERPLRTQVIGLGKWWVMLLLQSPNKPTRLTSRSSMMIGKLLDSPRLPRMWRMFPQTLLLLNFHPYPVHRLKMLVESYMLKH
jgi:hypothetical protein